MPVSASITDCGAGIGTAGPIISVRCTPLSIGRSRYAFRQRDAQPPPYDLRQLVGPHGAIGVADAPELLRIVEVMGGDVIETLVLLHHVLLQKREALRRRHEAAPEIDNGDAGSVFERRGLDAGVATRRGKWIGVHGMPAMPRVDSGVP